MKTNAEYQRDHRIRRAAKFERMEAALMALRAMFKDRTGPAGVEANRLIAEALGDGDPVSPTSRGAIQRPPLAP